MRRRALPFLRRGGLPAACAAVIFASVVLASVLPASIPALAQKGAPASVPLPPEAPARPAPPAPANPGPYDADLDRLAEIMGTLAFMRELCGDGDGTVWHDKMAALIAAEGTIGARDERLAGSYNRGFRGYQLTYRSCTDAAKAVVARSLEEGTRITREIEHRLNRE